MSIHGSAQQRRRRSRLARLFHFSNSRCNGGSSSSEYGRLKNAEMELSIRSIDNLSAPATGEAGVGTRPPHHQCSDEDDDVGGDAAATAADQAVGLDKPVHDVLKHLRDGSQRRRMTVGITGMEGCGKTTLARSVYEHPQVKEKFTCRAWVGLPSSEEYSTEEVLRRILRALIITGEVEEAPTGASEEEDDLKEEDLKEELLHRLRGKRYLVVLDNMRRGVVLDEIEPALPNDYNRSRLLFTRRAGDLASKANRFNYHLDLLDRKNSWELLSKIASWGGDHQQQQQPQPQVLEKLGRQLADKCSGLPRAIVFFGNRLRLQPQTEENLCWLVNNASRLIDSQVVSIYDNCPPHLRSCFLYSGMFPEKQTISARQLIQVWLAEGFIKFNEEAGGENNSSYAGATTTMEEKGEEILEELFDGNYIQVIERRAVDGGVKSIRGLFRDFCVYKGAELNIFQVSAEAEANDSSATPREMTTTTTTRTSPTKLAVYGNGKQVGQYLSGEAPYIATPHVSSLHYFLCDASEDANSSTPSASNSNSNSNNAGAAAAPPPPIVKLTWLGVLNLGAVKLDRVPDSLGSLIHLRYLRINAPTLHLVPPSIRKIPNLQTLDMRETTGCAVPDWIWKMHSLRHLYFGSSHAQLAAAGGSRSLFLEHLQTLSGIQPNRALKRLMVRAKFPNVSKLRLWSTDAGETREFLESLDHLYRLQSLRVMNPSTLPDAHAFPGELAKITLSGTELDDGGVQKLENLPNLRVLKLLENAISASLQELCCGEGGFPQLQVLHLVGLRANRLSNGRGGMRSVQRLVIKDCPSLAAIPEDLRLSFLELHASHLIPDETITKFRRRGSRIQILQCGQISLGSTASRLLPPAV